MALLFDEKTLETLKSLLHCPPEEVDGLIYREEVPETIGYILNLKRENELLGERVRKIEKKLLSKNMERDSLYDLTSEAFLNFHPETIVMLLRNIVMGQIGILKIIIFRRRNGEVEILDARGAGTSDRDSLASRIVKLSEGVTTASRSLEPDEEMVKEGFKDFFYFSSSTHGLGLLLGKKISGEDLLEEDAEFLSTVLKQALLMVDNIDLYRSNLEKEKMERELMIAQTIQGRMLPERLPENEYCRIQPLSASSYEVGGDFYDYVEGPNSLFISVGDVSGKGLSAALVMASAQATIRAMVKDYDGPLEEMMERINSLLLSVTRTEMYCTLFLLEVRPKEREIRWFNAGHPSALLLRDGAEVRELADGSFFLGLFDTFSGSAGSLPFRRGDKILLFTDGVSEFEIDGREIGLEGLKDLFLRFGDDVEAIRDYLSSHFQGERLKDDFTLLSVTLS